MRYISYLKHTHNGNYNYALKSESRIILVMFMMYGVDKINAFALAMLNQAELDDLLWSIAQGVGEIMEFDDCVIYLRSDDKLIQMAAFGIKNPKDREIFERIEIPIGQGIVGTVAVTGKAEIVKDTRSDPRTSSRRLTCLPLA